MARKGEEGRLVGRKASTVTFGQASGKMDQDFGPDHKAMRKQALAFHQKRDFDQAAGLYAAMLERWPEDAGCWSNLGVLLRQRGQVEAAIACYRKALAQTPDWPGAWSNLGNALREAGDMEAGLAAHDEALALDPDYAGNWHHRGIALYSLGRLEEAEQAFRNAINIDGDHVNANWDLARVLLKQGQYDAGWQQYHWRYKLPDLKQRDFESPRWQGEDIGGKTLLVYAEQGFGDTLLALRFMPALQARGCRVIVEIQPELQRLVTAMPGIDDVVLRQQTLPGHDVHASMMDLPMLLGVTLEDLPAPAGIAIPDAARRKIRPIIERRAGRLNIGIIWSGSVTFKNNHRRAVGLQRFMRFAALDGVRLFSLQKGPPAKALEALDCAPLLYDLGKHCEDFADTAAAIEALDLVVMTDSSVAHLAGSMGKPVWNLLDQEAYWLYLDKRADSPWYPSMTLYRQSGFGDWDGLFDQVEQDLKTLLESRRG